MNTDVIKVQIIRLEHAKGIELPSYATSGSVCMDLRTTENLIIKSQEIKLVPTGLIIILPENTEAQIRSRSGLALKNGLVVLNSPGTIDFDYRGEIKVILMNLGKVPVEIKRNDRIAQMLVTRTYKTEFIEVNNLDNDSQNDRKSGGFGSTGNQ